MKVSKIALACSMAFAAMSAQAASTGIPATPANVVFISGASGVDSYLSATASSLINVASYVHDSSNNYRAWYGTTKAAIGPLAAGSNLLIIKRSAGGSAMGVIPLAKATKVEVPNWADAAATADATANQYTVAVTTAANGLVPDIGVSDVEPKMFAGINTEFGYIALTAAEQATLTSASWSQIAEGIAVTKAVPDTYVLSNNFIREALAGHIQDWSSVDSTATDPVIVCRRIEGSGTQAAYNSYFHGFPNTAAYNGYGQSLPAITTDSFGYTKNAANDGSTALKPILLDPSKGFMVFEGSGSGDVRKCLQAAQLGIDATLVGRSGLNYKLQFSKVGGPSKAIGVLSLDSYTSYRTPALIAAGKATAGKADGYGYATSNTDANGEWNFRFLNGNGVYDVKNQVATSAATTVNSGIAPSRDNILTSYYDFTVEPTLQYRTATTGLVPAFYTLLQAALGNPTDMKVGSANNGAPLAYAALPALVVKNDPAVADSNLVADLTRQGNTTATLHVQQ